MSEVANYKPQPATCYLINTLFPELHLFILTYLRAFDLSSVQLTCAYFNDRNLINSIIQHTAVHVYPPELTEGFDTAIVGAAAQDTGGKYLTYEALRNMEMLVVARVLSRPEPPIHEREAGFYISKSWCKTALKWLEVQQEKSREKERLITAQAHSSHHGKKKKAGKKLSKKQERLRSRKMSDSLPPWPNVNDDILCPHQNLINIKGSKSARARRRVMDRQAWKVLKKLYPDSVQLDAVKGECLLCAFEAETVKKSVADQMEREKSERKKPLGDPLVRGFYTRSKGVPTHRLVASQTSPAAKSATTTPVKQGTVRSKCPLQPGIYQALPRAWCHRWRKYLKTGEGDRPCAPDGATLLCDAHKIPLIPPHLEAFLYGETPTLLAGIGSDVCSGSPASPGTPAAAGMGVASIPPQQQTSAFASQPVGLNPVVQDDTVMIEALRAAGVSEMEVQSQRMAMMSIEKQNQQFYRSQQIRRGSSQGDIASPDRPPSSGAGAGSTTNEQLDRENRVVVEILTDEEFAALLEWWPEIHSSYALRFAVGSDNNGGSDITWMTLPCRECDATGRGYGKDLVVRKRARRWDKRNTKA